MSVASIYLIARGSRTSFHMFTVDRRDPGILSRGQGASLILSLLVLSDSVSIVARASRHVGCISFTSPNSPVSPSTALKCDLRDDRPVKERLQRYGTHPVQYEEGLAVARRIRASRYLGLYHLSVLYPFKPAIDPRSLLRRCRMQFET